MLIKKLLKNPLFYIFLLGLLLRTFGLSDYPQGFHVDEAKAGWNAVSLMTTGKDDWGNPFPLHYNSFGDFRPTGYFYSIVPFLLVFGQNEFAVRFPAAIFGAFTIIILFYLCLAISRNNKKTAYFSSLILAVSPWHISLSRASSEGIVSLFFTLGGLLFLILAIKETKPQKLTLMISFLFFLISCFFYHIPRLLNPVLGVAVIFFFYRFDLSKYKSKLLIIFLAALILTTLAFGLNKDARGRFSQVSIFTDLTVKYEQDKLPFEEGHSSVLTARIFHNKIVLYATRFINEYTQYFSSKFLLVPFEAKPHRYSTVGNGIVTYIEFFLIVFGLVSIAKGKSSTLPLLLLLIAPIPAALTTEDAPNLHRSLYMTPFFGIIAGMGIVYLLELKWRFSKYSTLIALSLLLLNFIYFAHMYFIHNHQRPQIAPNRNVGAKELALKLNNADKYQKVLITNIPDSLYPWYAFFNKIDPESFNDVAKNRAENPWSYKNITFTSLRCPSRDAFKKNNDNILAVDAEGCETEANYGKNIRVLERIARGDQSYPYILWHRVALDDPKTWEEATPPATFR